MRGRNQGLRGRAALPVELRFVVPSCQDLSKEEAQFDGGVAFQVKPLSKPLEAAEVEVAGGLKMGAKSLCVPLEDRFGTAMNCAAVAEV